MRKIITLGMLIVIVFGVSCLRRPQGVSVIGYRDQMVFLKKGSFYRVGELPAGWNKMKSSAKVAAFHNSALRSTISTDAFCGSYFEDLPLKTLTNQFFAGTSREAPSFEKEFILDERGAFRSIAMGKVDGVSLKFDSVVLKKNNCTIDFVYISPPENYAAGVADFEAFYNGFRF